MKLKWMNLVTLLIELKMIYGPRDKLEMPADYKDISFDDMNMVNHIYLLVFYDFRHNFICSILKWHLKIYMLGYMNGN